MEGRNCDVATELRGRELAKFRLYRADGLRHFAIAMSGEQISERRIYLRKALRNHPRWENLSNDELNDIRLYDAGSGYIVEDRKGYEYFLSTEKVSKDETEFRRIRAMMPFEFMNLTGKDFKWGKYKSDVSGEKEMAVQFITKYPKFKERGMGLYIYSGTKGSGKTMLSCCLLNEIAQRYTGSVKFVNILDFIELTKKGFNDGGGDVAAIYQAGLLALDDIGVQMSKEWIETVLYRLVNYRYVNRLPTIYTSNISVGSLRIDERITDRIESTSYLINLPEEPVRRDVRQREKEKLLEEIRTTASV